MEAETLNAWIHRVVFDGDNIVGLVKRGYWYRPNACGYTNREDEAWHLSREEAAKHEYRRGDEPVTIRAFTMPAYDSDLRLVGRLVDRVCELLNGADGLVICQREDGMFLVDAAIGSDLNEEKWQAEEPTLNLALCRFLRKAYEDLKANQIPDDFRG